MACRNRDSLVRRGLNASSLLADSIDLSSQVKSDKYLRGRVGAGIARKSRVGPGALGDDCAWTVAETESKGMPPQSLLDAKGKLRAMNGEFIRVDQGRYSLGNDGNSRTYIHGRAHGQ